MNTTDKLKTLIIEPQQAANASIIWMHGLGANAHDFEPIVPDIQLHKDTHLRYIFPNAPIKNITINAGMPMNAWYDITELDLSQRHEDEAGINESSNLIQTLIDQETSQGIPATRILLAGFSQGGAIALHAGLSYPKRLAGIVALSCYLPRKKQWPTQAHTINKGLPILMMHGDHDPIIPVDFANDSALMLNKHGYDLAWHTYPMAHQLC